ncbi:DNA repair protein RecN [Desulfoplanes formicivorans]|uniref:DNA repair protein RecN n=1 Tax=Desulfoplanes formicivorans TaxID=1592317 RepID=A0A194AGT4_9BACT|nr:AAA family ATPase [Desulfoplanes formicivorans]GAU08420.1 DNA recombination protein RecN [Desulfoplanes formicivorans]
MLEFLRIRNLALIEDVEMDFVAGLNVLTGESGAGKSFILSALDFILGERISSSMIRSGCEKAQVEAIFVLDGQEVILRREILAETGRSRIYINDKLGSQEKVQALGPSLLIHTSQHGQQKLLRPAYHVHIVDGFLDDPGLLVRHREMVREMAQILAQEQEIRDRVRGLEEKRDFLEYQQAEIQKVAPKPGEEEALLAEKKIIQAQADSREMIHQSLEVINGQEFSLLEGLGVLQSHVQALADLDERYAEYASHMEDARQSVLELDRELRSEPMDFEHQARLEAIESRLWKLAQLQRRLKRSLDRILELEQEIQDNIAFLDQSNLQLTQLERKRMDLAQDLATLTQQLNTARSQAAKVLKERLEDRLKDLGFSDKLELVFEIERKEIHPDIFEERPRIFWVPNPGQPPQPLDKIASGGELSRFLLAVVGLRAERDMPTLLFDEVDSGIGGITLNKVAASIQDLARRQQVILITHWPQLAAMAERHFHIQKQVRDGKTFTLCSRLKDKEIVAELARMAGGGDKGMMLARELVGKTG